jgi:hypothetical protein
MNTAQASMVAALVLLLIGSLVRAITTESNTLETLLNIGVPMALSALAGGLTILIKHAEVLQDASSVAHGKVIAGSTVLGVHGLSRFGGSLLLDDVWVYVVWAIALGVILFDIKVAAPERKIGPKSWPRYLGLGLALPAALGAAALFIIYTRS